MWSWFCYYCVSLQSSGYFLSGSLYGGYGAAIGSGTGLKIRLWCDICGIWTFLFSLFCKLVTSTCHLDVCLVRVWLRKILTPRVGPTHIATRGGEVVVCGGLWCGAFI